MYSINNNLYASIFLAIVSDDWSCVIKIYIKKNKTSFMGPNNQVPDKSNSFNTYVEINIGVCTI